MPSQAFKTLEDFIQNKMRMSHVYQPVMLLELLRLGGAAPRREIAKALLSRDESQIEYYEQITNNMVGRVLTKNRGLTTKEGDIYSLKAYAELSDDEILELVSLCEEKIDAYIDKRGKRIWEHRKKSSGYISGTLRYEVLKRAKFRCELCGVMDKDKALEVDHIVPRNNDGTDDISNLQALCYSCNAMKRDRDDTDFRGIADSYNHREEGCIFCDLKPDQVIAENELMFVIRDRYPVTELHTLIIPKRHCETYFDLYQPELNAMNQLLQSQRDAITDQDNSVAGFNIGANAGAASGQTVDHCHVHLIPRRSGDVNKPRGGVRGVIPERQDY